MNSSNRELLNSMLQMREESTLSVRRLRSLLKGKSPNILMAE
jgi:hypothetical protein